MNLKTIMSGGLVLLVAAIVTVPSLSNTDGVDWIVVEDYDQISELAQKENKPVILFFSAGWSEPSQKMIKAVWTDEKVISLSKKYICVAVESEKSSKIESRFKVTTYPTLIVTDPWGNAVLKKSGFIPAKSLTMLMAVFPADFTHLSKLKESVEKGIASGEALGKLAEYYARMQDYESSNDYLSKALESEAIKENPKLRDELLQKIALNQLRLHNYEKALEAFEAAMEQLSDEELQAKLNYGIFIAYIGMKKYNEAEKILKKLEKEFPGSKAATQAKIILESLKKYEKKQISVTIKK